MSFIDCLNRSIEAGEFDPNRSKEARDLYDELMSEGARFDDATAGQRTFDILQFQAFQRKRQRMMQLQVSEARFQEMKSYTNAHGQKDMAAGFRAMHDRDEFAQYTNIEAERKAYRGRAQSIMSNVLATFRPNVLGKTRNKASLRSMVHEVFGKDTGDKMAKELAQAWSEGAEFLRKTANRFGMAIPKRADWGMPQTHNTLKVRETSMQDWVTFVRDKVDPQKLIDYSRGFNVNELQTDLILREVYETITTKGFSNSEPALTAGKQKLGNKRAEHRFLPFKDSDAWLEYHDRFGVGDPYSVMMAHVDGMSKDIA
ncbi:MAG: hypothetical protein ACR2QF_02305, partial [Geminicoccaceae bacterium]